MKLATTTGKSVEIKLKSPELHGRWVRLLAELANGEHHWVAGSYLRIAHYGGGMGKFKLETPTCPHCGVSTYITGVSQTRFELHADVDAAGKLVWLEPEGSKP